MGCSWEKVYRGGDLKLIAEGCKLLAVAGEGCAIAGNVHQFLRGHLGNGFEHLVVTALTRRVYHDNIGSKALLCQLGCRLLGICADEARVDSAESVGIGTRIFDGIRNDFDADELLHLRCHRQADGTGTAIQIHQQLISLELSQLGCQTVELLGCLAIDLIKAQRRKLELHVTQGILNGVLAIDGSALAAQNHIILFPIDIEDHRCHLRADLEQALKVLRQLRKLFAIEYQTSPDTSPYLR